MSIEKQSQNITRRHGVNIDEGVRKEKNKDFPSDSEKFSFCKFEFFSLHYQFTQPFHAKWNENEKSEWQAL